MDGERLATGAGRKLRLWTPAGDLLRECSPHASTVTDIAWHPSRQQLATACYGGVSFWQPDRTEAVRRFTWKGSLLTLAWSPNGKLLASGDQDASVHFWFVVDGTDLHMSGYAGKVRELAWSADSRLLATGGSVDVVLWDCSKKGPANTRPLELQHHGTPISQLAFQGNGPLLASGCAGGVIAMWHPRKSRAPLGTARLDGALTELAWSPDNARIAAGTGLGTVGTFAAPAL
jgi:WD40 repeat protein